MHSLYGKAYLSNPWLNFKCAADSSRRWCQPDGILIDHISGVVTIFECKYSHCARAWWQLHRLYGPVLKKLFPSHWELRYLEIVYYFDPAVVFPGKIELCREIDFAPTEGVGVHIWQP